jgi:hypothetical protein
VLLSLSDQNNPCQSNRKEPCRFNTSRARQGREETPHILCILERKALTSVKVQPIFANLFFRTVTIGADPTIPQPPAVTIASGHAPETAARSDPNSTSRWLSRPNRKPAAALTLLRQGELIFFRTAPATSSLRRRIAMSFRPARLRLATALKISVLTGYHVSAPTIRTISEFSFQQLAPMILVMVQRTAGQSTTVNRWT